MDDHAMDIDSDTPHEYSGPHLALSPSGTKHPLLPLPEMMKLNDMMNQYSNNSGWKRQIEEAGDNTSKWRFLLRTALATILVELSTTSLKESTLTWNDAIQLIEDDTGFNEWQRSLNTGVEKGNWAELVAQVKLGTPCPATMEVFWGDQRLNLLQKLMTAYKTPFIGDAAINFIKYLETTDVKIRTNTKPIYAKAIAVVQSSGTGKSRMLTEASRQIFALPICLRKEGDPGYPPSDLDVVKYFAALSKDNDLSLTGHIAIACFLAAAHKSMLECLQEAKSKGQADLLGYWNKFMEPQGADNQRDNFFSVVVKQANKLRSQAKKYPPSPRRGQMGDPEPINISKYAAEIYEDITKKATEDLMHFLSSVQPLALSMMYFDEAHEFGLCLWPLLRLLQRQEPLTKMWYVFLGTKSSISYYSPCPTDRLSLRLKDELSELLPPYIALGFDQQMIAKKRAEISICMGDIQSIEHLSQYGRPLWNAHLPDLKKNEMISLASLKLTNGHPFLKTNKQHVFTVLSQRLCLDPVLASSKAIKLADCSVSHHMRLLTGFKGEIFSTHSSSEPMLVLGSIDILYNSEGGHGALLGPVLQTLSQDLCSSGLVEKGVLGELGARILLLVARDYSAPRDHTPNLLEPVCLLDFLHTLFGNEAWAGTNLSKFNDAFDKAYVNFTHWMVMKDPMPEVPDLQLLANLWARGAALQCCFTQEAIDFIIPIYIGSVLEDAIFDPSCLSVVAGQVKFKAAGDKAAENAIRPIGIPRNLDQPLPYLAMLMELGNMSNYQESGSRIKSTAFNGPITDGDFRESNLPIAVKHLESHQGKKEDEKTRELKKMIKEAQLAMDPYNRYSISVRGATPDVYQVLSQANIVEEFATLLQVTMPSPNSEDRMIQYMQPLERLGVDSNHTAWMSKYVVQ